MAVLEGALPGDVIALDGLVLDGIIDVPSGTADAPIVIRGNGATTLTGTLRLASHVRVEGILFISDGTHAWVEGETGSRQVAFVGNAFDINCMNCGDAFFGMVLPGDEHLFCGNRVGWWLGDTLSFKPANGLLIADNDFRGANADHAVISGMGDDWVVLGNVFRNQWDRVLHIASVEPEVLSTRALIEDNVFIDSDWDRMRARPREDEDIANDGGGAAETVRLNGARHIFRNNVVVGNRRGADRGCHGALSLSMWEDASWSNRQLRDYRIYGNTFVFNETSGIGIVNGIDLDSISGNQISQNVFLGNGRTAIAVCTDVLSGDDIRLESNLFGPEARVDFPEREPETVAGLAHAFVGDNEYGDVALVDAALWDALRDDHELLFATTLETLFGAFALRERREAGSLTTVAEPAADSDLLRVRDALWFHGEVGGVPGDAISVDGQDRAVVSVVDETTLRLDRPLTAPEGALVTLRGATLGVHTP